MVPSLRSVMICSVSAVLIEEARTRTRRKAHADEHRLDDGRDALVKTGFDDQPRFVGCLSAFVSSDKHSLHALSMYFRRSS